MKSELEMRELSADELSLVGGADTGFNPTSEGRNRPSSVTFGELWQRAKNWWNSL